MKNNVIKTKICTSCGGTNILREVGWMKGQKQVWDLCTCGQERLEHRLELERKLTLERNLQRDAEYQQTQASYKREADKLGMNLEGFMWAKYTGKL